MTTDSINTLKIENKNIGENSPVYFIADIAANHDGDLQRAKDLIWLAAESGADAAKFQHFKADTIVSDYGFKKLGSQMSHQSKWKKSVYQVYEEASVNWDWTLELKKTCKEADITFFTTPYSLEVVDYIDDHVPAYKIGSGDITWHEMITKVASKNKPYILATGASNMHEVYEAVEVAININQNLALMQCNTNYTSDLENFKFLQLNVLRSYKEMFPKIILGLSDHTPGHSSVLGAITLGAKVIEKHFTDDQNREGPDHVFSMYPTSWKEMVLRARELESALGNGVKKIEQNEQETVILQRRSIRAKKDLDKGQIISYSDLCFLRPAPKSSLPPFKLNEIIGKKLNKSIQSGDTITFFDIINT